VELDFWGKVRNSKGDAINGLNPYSGGTWFLSTENMGKQGNNLVLILILVELDFWAMPSIFYDLELKRLNPYSGGTWFLRIDVLNNRER